MIYIIFGYLLLVNLFSVCLTIFDKKHAKVGGQRVPEKTLLLFSALGGGVGMYITMLLIRHKTRKPLFMIGIPVIIILELLVLGIVNTYVIKII